MTSRLEQITRVSGRGWRRGSLILAAVLLVPACGAVDTQPLPVAPTPSMAPASLVLTAASVFNQPMAVQATVFNAAGQPVPNVSVAFSIGTGTITPPAAVTDGNGMARATAVSPASTTISAATANGIASSVPILPSETQ
jgi:hypothetical protein